MLYSIMEKTPVGCIRLAGIDGDLKELQFVSTNSPVPDSWERSDPEFRDVVRQLRAYFDGKLTQFDVALRPDGTPFQQRVWKALCRVKFGKTASYGEIAEAVGQPTASRAVGMANGRNPIAILIPCHRIIGSSGKLVGYSAGLDLKRRLLTLEGAALGKV